jgi:uncharacterized membrane protein
MESPAQVRLTACMSGFVEIATLVTALGCGLVAGVWFTFSAFVMPALDRLAAAEGIAAMQSINRLAVTPPLMIAMFGTALACLGLAVWAVASLGESEAPLVLAAAALYLVGTIVVTIAANVPRNDALEQLDPHGVSAGDGWDRYVREWTAWNHVRLVTSLAAAALLTIALIDG